MVHMPITPYIYIWESSTPSKTNASSNISMAGLHSGSPAATAKHPFEPRGKTKNQSMSDPKTG